MLNEVFDKTNKLLKIESIINSCVTLDQLKSCNSFIVDDSFFTDIKYKYEVLDIFVEKAKQLKTT